MSQRQAEVIASHDSNASKPTAAGRLLALTLVALGAASCYAEASGPSMECRSAEVRNRHDVEVCHARCGDDGCREHCAERERWAHEHRCWVD